MSTLYRRAISATLGTRQYTNFPKAGEKDHIGLRIAFDIQKTTDTAKPDRCAITLYNLNAESRTAMQTTGAPVEIEAGYFDTAALIFRGKIERATSSRQGATWVTRVYASDGGAEAAAATTSRSHAAGTALSAVVQKFAEDMGVSIGKASRVLVSALKTPDGIAQLINGGAFAGAPKTCE